MNAMALPLLNVVLHTLAMYLFLILGLRLIGHRQLGQLTSIDLVVLILLGSAVETAMVAGNTTLPAGLVSAATLLVANRTLSFLALRSPRFRHLVVGQTLLLIQEGVLLEENLRRAGLTEADLLEALRERGHAAVGEVRYAIWETDGRINVIPCDAATQPRRTSTVVGSGSNIAQTDRSIAASTS